MGEYGPNTKKDREVISKAKECDMEIFNESKLGNS